MNKALYTVWVFTRVNTKRFFRDKLAIFFGILFPLIFLFVFGFINKGGNEISFDVAVINQSDSAFAKQFVKDMGKQKIFEIDKEITTVKAADEKMSRSQLDAAIILPKNFGEMKGGDTFPSGTATVRYAQNNQQAGSALTSILSAQFKGINANITPQVEPFKAEGKPTEQAGLSQFDYAFAGLLGFSIIGIGIFGPMNVFPELKKQGILRRLRMTPLRVWQYFVSTALTQVILGLVSIAILFFFAVTVFDLHIVGNWFEIIPFIALSIVMILGIGLAIGGWAKNERQAAPLGNIVVFPMMFLSGTFFPRFLMPEWLQNISNFLPLTPVVDGIRLLVTEGQGLIDIAPQLGLIGAWLIVIYIVAFRFFRWE
ncbi:MAG TPA: ABC transporter permease [Candidatus Saccharimonadales bacterium]|nr:ABC transporter permease [Candidatus Saccharimonadales bacterium]